MTNGKFWTTDCIRHPKRRLCVCCPNGVHVDAELDVFYKTLTKMQQRSANGTATVNPSKQFKYFKRKQDPTVDALLGGGGQRTQSTVNLDETFYKVSAVHNTRPIINFTEANLDRTIINYLVFIFYFLRCFISSAQRYAG